MVSVNNLLQYQYFTLISWQNELNRQYELKVNDKDWIKGKTKDQLKRIKDREYTLSKEGIKGQIFYKIRDALKHTFGVVIGEEIQGISYAEWRTSMDQEHANRVRLPQRVPDEHDNIVTYMTHNKVIGYLVNIELDDGPTLAGHWLAIKYFGGKGTSKGVQGWYAWDGSALYRKKPLYRGNSFDAVYNLVWNYWTNERNSKIVKNILYECRKKEEGADGRVSSYHNDYDYGEHNENRKFFDGDVVDDNYEIYDEYKDNGNYLLLLLSILGIETIVILCSCTICMGGIITFMYYCLLHHKDNKDEGNNNTI